MSEQVLDLKGSVRIIRRHWLAVSLAAVLGLAAGAAYSLVRPPALTSTALVRVVTPKSAFSANSAATLVVIASSDPVLTLALPHIHPPESAQALQNQIQVRSPTSGIVSIRAQGRTAAQAQGTANAVARGFVQYIRSPRSLSGKTGALTLGPASVATGRSPAVSAAIFGLIGALLAGVLAAIGVLAVNRRDRKLRQRDDIADSIGIPVLASIPVSHPGNAAEWVQLLTEYQPAAVDAWRLRGVLDYLGVTHSRHSDPVSLAVISLRSDPGALAIGPQLAAFAASMGIPTQLIVGTQQDPDVAANLRAACTGTVRGEPGSYLQLRDRSQDNDHGGPNAGLTVLVTVVDEKAPRADDPLRTTVTLLAVSAGTATAEDLARVAVSAVNSGRQTSGILVADPDPADPTTGRIAQLGRTTARRAPTHMTGIPTETRQWMTQTQRSS